MGQKKIARKKRAPLEDSPSDPSSLSSSQEDEQLTDQEEEENHYPEPTKETPESESSKDEEEQEVQEVEEKVEKTKPSVKKPITPAKPQHPQSSDSDPGSDSETHLGSPTFTKSIASKPKKPTSSKRLMQEFEKTANQSQKKKKAKVVVEEEEKKSVGAINRLWSVEDEVLILKGLIDFQSKNGSDLHPDMGKFHELIKESLSVDVSKNQFVDKIRKLKRKYSINVEKAVFSRPHERKCFDLSKKIWGEGKEKNGIDGNEKTIKHDDSAALPKENDGKESALGDENTNGVDGNGKSSRSKRARKTVEREKHLPEGNGKEGVALGEELKGGKLKDMEVDEVGDFWAMHPCLKESLEIETETGMPSDLLRKNPVRRFLKKNMSTIGNEKAMELEKKWKNLRADEVVLSLRRGELMNEQAKLVLDAMNASKD
ncbi:STOREKEEPER protein-like [Rhododendron vialii]|uniref:STOREKEEPER protein-like n=1 Tax=Rhododendron vialii TaxID=182163 RepID=UPI00265F8861|nr:STOREKEEPER protein-like [Rhododendron vialii]